jgi:hypothetical protein
VVLWPGADATSEAGAKFLRTADWRGAHFVRNLPPLVFLRLLSQAEQTIGNSSAFVREGRYLGVPTITIGAKRVDRA